MVHRRDHFRAEKILQERLFAKPNVKIIWDHEVTEYTGSPAKPPMPASVSGVKLRNTRTGAVSDMPIDGSVVRGNRTCAGSRALQGQAAPKAERLPVDGAGFDGHRRGWRLRPPAT